MRDLREECNALDLNAEQILKVLLEEEVLCKAESRSPKYPPILRYLWGHPSSYQLAISLRRNSFLCHRTALVLHGLEQPSKLIYVNQEQTPKSPSGGSDETVFTPADSIALHKNFASKLLKWFGKNLSGPRVVISHNAPVINPNSKFKGGPLTPAFNSLDMVEIIGTHQPALWVYGHTHECDDQTIGRTRIISNQLGYPGNLGGFECKDFDEAGLPVEVGV